MTYIITFKAHFDAILAHRTLMSGGIAAQLMPTPRAVSAACGTCVRFDWEAPQEIPESKVAYDHAYRQGEDGWEKIE